MTYRYTITHPTEKTIQRIFSAVWTRAKVLESMDAEMDSTSVPFGSMGMFYEIEERVTETRTKRGGK